MLGKAVLAQIKSPISLCRAILVWLSFKEFNEFYFVLDIFWSIGEALDYYGTKNYFDDLILCNKAHKTLGFGLTENRIMKLNDETVNPTKETG